MSRIHFIGICGTGMATMAAMLKQRGHEVAGSDQDVYPPMSTFLAEQGVSILAGYHAEHIGPDLDLVVIGNAISRGNPELEEVLDRKIRYCSLPEAIRDHFLWGARSIVIAGTHGKTTTTAMAGWLLAHGGLDPTVFVGGIANNFGSSWRRGAGRDFVLEGDEYDSAFFDKTAKFLKYLPDIVVVGNIEFDHVDIYPDLEALVLAFRRLVTLIPRRGRLILGADSPAAAVLKDVARCPVETVGLADEATWQLHDVRVGAGRTRFAVRRDGQPFGSFELPVIGEHNALNAAAALALGAAVGLDGVTLAEGLRRFGGVRRRLEIRGVAGGVTVYDDFAHHPTAVAETLAAVRAAYPDRRVWALFEPRSASSCRRIFQEDFARALAGADRVVVAAVFRGSVPEAERLSPDRLVADLRARGMAARHIPAVDDIVPVVAREAAEGDVVVVMSNGAFGGIQDKLVRALEAREARPDL